jgi:chromosome segregation ATPase
MKQQCRLRDSLLLLLSFCSVAATAAIGSDDFDEVSSDDSNDDAVPKALPQQNVSEKSAGEAAVEVSPSVQLHNMLAAANHYSEELEGRLKKAQEIINTEKEREGQLEVQVDTANHTNGQYREALVEAKRRLRVLQRNNSNLLESLRNATAAQTEVQQKLLLTNRSRQETESELGVVKAQLNNSGGTHQDFERVRQALKRAEDQATTEGKRTKEEWTAMQTALHQLVQVKHELDVSKQQLVDEVAQEAVLNETFKSQIEKLQNERAVNEKKLVQESMK